LRAGVRRARKGDYEQARGQRGDAGIVQNEPKTRRDQSNCEHACARPRQMQYGRDQRNAAKELHLVKFDEELSETAGGPRHAGGAGGNQRLRLDDRVPQIERQSA
jgi:hypothetical protein